MQITLLNSRHNSEIFNISFAFLRILFMKFSVPKNSPVFWTTLYIYYGYKDIAAALLESSCVWCQVRRCQILKLLSFCRCPRCCFCCVRN